MHDIRDNRLRAVQVPEAGRERDENGLHRKTQEHCHPPHAQKRPPYMERLFRAYRHSHHGAQPQTARMAPMIKSESKV